MLLKRELRRLLNENTSINLFHGSQAEINQKDGFLTKYIKSGEGNNIFGWGLYFTDNINVAKEYAKNNTANIYNRYINLGKENFKTNDISKLIKIFSNSLNDFKMFDPEQYENLLKVIKFFKKAITDGKKTTDELIDKGFLYYVTITPSKPNAFFWNQEYDGEVFNLSGKLLGSDIFKQLLKNKNDKQVSEFLYSLGFYGIIYPVGTIDSSKGSDGFNYVIFNDKDIKITKVEKL